MTEKQKYTRRKDDRGRILKDGETQLADGRYKFQYTDPAGNRRAIYAWRLIITDRTPPGKRDGKCLRDKEAEIEKDLFEGIDGKTAREMTLNEMFEVYMAGKVNLKQSTRTNYLYMYEKYVSEGLGKRTLQSIKYSDIKRFYNALITDMGFKPNSMEIINTILHPVFTLAVRDGYIRANPTEGVMADIKKSHNWEKPKRHALSIDEQAAFIDFIADSYEFSHWLPLFAVLLGTGCRIGELLGLRWEDVDFEAGTISINHNLIYRIQDTGKMALHITTPKTSAGCRTIPMLSDVREALYAQRRQQLKNREGKQQAEVDGYTGFIFTNRYGDVFKPELINRTICRICKAYNKQETERAEAENREPLLIRHFSAHNLRHTFCTRFCENETNIKVIQEIMGHSDISTTMNIYAEATEDKKREAFVNLEGKIKIC